VVSQGGARAHCVASRLRAPLPLPISN
jgi:hypothetical protein